jgi:NitT/TauT family transport system substrate-binding protein
MRIMHNRRRFLTGLSAAGAAGLIGQRSWSAVPLDTTAVRFADAPAVCLAPQYMAEDLLRADGFTDVSHVVSDAGTQAAAKLASGEIDFAIDFASAFVVPIDAGQPIKVVGGLHAGCYELFAQKGIRSVIDLKGKRVGVGQNLKSDPYLFISAMANYVGLDPVKDINWVTGTDSPMQLFIDGKVDAFLGFSIECQELRARKIGHVIISGGVDRPWAQYFCCVMAANAAYVQKYPIATKRVLRAIYTAADMVQADPKVGAQELVERGFTRKYDLALQSLKEIHYSKWREYDPEDTIRFIALRLHEAGMIQSSPQKVIADGTEWKFLSELKREL